MILLKQLLSINYVRLLIVPGIMLFLDVRSQDELEKEGKIEEALNIHFTQ